MEKAIVNTPLPPSKKTPNRSRLQRVLLQRSHTHQGVLHAAGQHIQVHPDTAAWLRTVGVVAPAKS